MKKLVYFILFFQLSAMTGACQKPPLLDPIPQNKFPTNLEMVWLSPLCLDSAGGGWILDFEIANEQYIVVAKTFGEDERPLGIGVYNMQTGKRHSAWQNDPGGIFAVGEVKDLADCKVAGKNRDIILIYNRYDLFGYSLHSGQRLWTTTIKSQTSMGLPKMSADVDNAYISYSPKGILSKSWCRLAKVDVYSGTKIDILELYIQDNHEFDINPPSSYVNSEGDTLLFFTTDGLNFETLHYRGDAYCYNLTKKQIVWVNKEFRTDAGASSFDPPPFVIENDKLIITTRKAISCLNKNTGAIIWQMGDLSFPDMPPLYYEGKLYLRCRSFSSDATLLCLDAQTGQQIWENTTSKPLPAPEGRMAIYKDRLYCSISGGNGYYYLFCADIHTGKELWRDYGFYGNIAFDVLIDPKIGYFYCYTGWSTMCIDLNKTPKK